MTKIYIVLFLCFSICVQAKEPFVRSGGHILMSGGTQENEKLFVFDTGSSVTVVSKDFCKTANCKKTLKWIPVIDYKGKWKMYRVARIPDFYLGNLHFKNVRVIVKKDVEHAFDGFVCENLSVEGILGYNLLGQHNWKLNFTDTTYSTQQTPIQLENGYSLDFRLRRRLPYVSLPINGQFVKNILFDTGDPSAIVLSSDTFNQLFTENVHTRQFLAGSLNNAAKKQYTEQLYKGNVSILSDSHSLIVSSIANRRHNIIGGRLLTNSIVAINYSDRTIDIDKAEGTIIWDKIVGIGFGFEEQNIIITSIFTDLAEQYPELQLGKTVKTVNRKNSQDLAEMNPCERRIFLHSLNRGDLEIVMETGTVYNLSAIY